MSRDLDIVGLIGQTLVATINKDMIHKDNALRRSRPLRPNPKSFSRVCVCVRAQEERAMARRTRTGGVRKLHPPRGGQSSRPVDGDLDATEDAFDCSSRTTVILVR